MPCPEFPAFIKLQHAGRLCVHGAAAEQRESEGSFHLRLDSGLLGGLMSIQLRSGPALNVRRTGRRPIQLIGLETKRALGPARQMSAGPPPTALPQPRTSRVESKLR